MQLVQATSNPGHRATTIACRKRLQLKHSASEPHQQPVVAAEPLKSRSVRQRYKQLQDKAARKMAESPIFGYIGTKLQPLLRMAEEYYPKADEKPLRMPNPCAAPADTPKGKAFSPDPRRYALLEASDAVASWPFRALTS